MNIVQPIRDREKIEEIKQLLLVQSYRNYILFMLGIYSGLRISDILQLRVRDVKDRTHITISEKKTGKPKRFLIVNELRTALEPYIKTKGEEDWLFPSRKGEAPITRVQAYKIINDVARKVGLDEIGTHTLRKTFGYFHYQAYKDVATLQMIFNHSAPSITLRYIGISQDIMDEQMRDFKI